MARVLITSGPTRQYLDPVRYLTNDSSGRMGQALARAALAKEHEVVIVSGPVKVAYPNQAEVVPVISTEDMLAACLREFPSCDGIIGVAAPCDYRPLQVEYQKIAKTGDPLVVHLVETPDVLATLGSQKRASQWIVGFALETADHRCRAVSKLKKKRCDLIVLNHAAAMNSATTDIEILDAIENVVWHADGTKTDVATGILDVIQQRLIAPVAH